MAKPDTWILRPIRQSDNESIAQVIHDVMTEHACTGPGFAIHDAEVADMHGAYSVEGAGYFVIEHGGVVMGGGGYARLEGTSADEATCELRKMYFRQEGRGLGLGHSLIELLLDDMRSCGYRRCYLETTSWMATAQHLYGRHGFEEAPGPIGDTGHHGCDKFFVRTL